MKHKTLSTRSAEFLNYLIREDKQCFTVEFAYNILKNKKKDTVRKLLSDLAARGLLLRLKNGLYYIIPYEKDPNTFFPDWHIVANYLTQGANQYIGYYSALEIHNLITQPALTEQIVVDKQIKPSKIKIKDIEFQFIYHNQKHFFGAKDIWINNYDKVKCSDLDKTIIDCLYKPDYAGGIVEIAKSIYKAKDKINYQRLFEYLQRFNNQSVIKRIGFLLELLSIENPIIEKLLSIKTKTYALLDPTLPKIGKMNNNWNIQINSNIETIKSSIFT